MNERYTYGYNTGWNSQNEYIDSLNEMLEAYNNQIQKLNELEKQKVQLENFESIEYKDTEYTDEQIRQWYNEDYSFNGGFVTFEEYKKQILPEIEKYREYKFKEQKQEIEQLKQQKLIDIDKNTDEYFANLKYLIDIKNDNRKLILKRKNDLNLLLSDKKIELSSILLEQQRTMPEYDENRNVINSKKLNELREKYDQTWLEIRKIEHAIEKTDEMFKLMGYTNEEIDLMMKGLNSRQEDIYNQIQKQVITEATEELVEEPEEIQGLESVQENAETVSDKNLDLDDENLEERTEESIVANHSQKTLEEVVSKVCGDKTFTESQSSKYSASKIKIFEMPQKNNLGLVDKVISISKSIIGIIPRTAMKLYGQFISEDTKDMFEVMESNSMDLTDDEVKLLLNEYNDNSVPKGFDNVVKPRVNLYVSKRVDDINSELNDALFNIACSQKIIKESNNDNLVNDAYLTANNHIKSLIPLQLEVDKLLENSQLHSFELKLKSLNSKLNYVGARFERAKDYDPSLWSKVSGLSQKIEYSLVPKEVVDSYIERENIYKENNKHKNYLSEEDLMKLEQLDLGENVNQINAKTDDTSLRRANEIKDMIENLKSMKAELTEEDIKEIEALLR